MSTATLINCFEVAPEQDQPFLRTTRLHKARTAGSIPLHHIRLAGGAGSGPSPRHPRSWITTRITKHGDPLSPSPSLRSFASAHAGRRTAPAM